MSIDFQARHLQQNCEQPEDRIHVLVHFRNDVMALVETGFQVTSVAGDVASGSVPVGYLKKLERHPDVILVEASRALKDETDVSSVAINLIDPTSGLRVIPSSGRGAIIGIIDSGFDLTHPCFTNAQDTTRILAAWDQANRDNLAGSPPDSFDYGIEYTREAIDLHIAAGTILVVRNQNGAGPHGTYVAGIAAGNGAPHGIYKGIAPEADLILVTYRNDVPIGGSAFVLDAITYIQERAHASGRSVVINISQGDSLGAHDGTSLLERAIDNVVGKGRVQVVVSAGNGRHRPAKRHARAEVEHGRDLILPFALTPDATHPIDGDTLELWYRRGDNFAVALKTPGGWMSGFVPQGTSTVIKFPAGNQARVYSEIDHPLNGDNHIGIILEKGEGWEAGGWELILRGVEVRRGDFDIWADRPFGTARVNFKRYQSDVATVTLPGNARRAITVGSFVSRPVEGGATGDIKGGIALGSSIGPTRDGRVKPDLTAPGSLIMAPRLRSEKCPPKEFPPCYDPLSGTSMAAPHVAGVIALLWALWPELTAEQIRAALYSTARNDTFTGATPNTSWGSGKLDAGAAYKSLSTQLRNGETQMNDTGRFETQLTLKSKDGRSRPVTLQLELDGNNVVGLRGFGQDEKEEYEVSFFVVRKTAGGDECYMCTRKPCPPNEMEEVDPCPIPGTGGVKK